MNLNDYKRSVKTGCSPLIMLFCHSKCNHMIVLIVQNVVSGDPQKGVDQCELFQYLHNAVKFKNPPFPPGGNNSSFLKSTCYVLDGIKVFYLPVSGENGDLQ